MPFPVKIYAAMMSTTKTPFAAVVKPTIGFIIFLV